MDETKVRTLIDEARKASERAHELLARDRKDGAWVNAEAKANYEAAVSAAVDQKATADEAVKEYETEKKLAGVADWLSESKGRLPGMATPITDEPAAGIPRVQYKSAKTDNIEYYTPSGTDTFSPADEVAYTDTFRQHLRRGHKSLEMKGQQLARQKALQAGLDASGGALVASEVFVNKLIERLEDLVMMRQLGTVLPPLTSAASVRFPTASPLDDAAWTQELATGSADSATPFGDRALTPHPLAKRVLISNTLLRLSGIDVEAWVRSQGAKRFSAAEESAFMTGTGAQQPLGVFVSTLPTTVTCASSTDIAYNDLNNMEFSLKAQYRPGASWILHRTIMKELWSLVDGTGRPLLREIPNAGARFSLLNFDVHMSEYAPSSSATTLKVAALGNWKEAYYIQDTLNLTVQVLDQLYAETNQTGYIFRKETDGMIVDGNGCSLLVMA